MFCEFCTEFKSFKDSQFFELTNWKYPNRILLENEYFKVLPAYGPLVYPYLLIVTNLHFLNITELPKHYYPYFTSIIKEVQLQYKSFNRWVFFEHGGCNGVAKEVCINHFHLHMIPFEFDIIKHFKSIFSPKIFKSILDIDIKAPYLLISYNLENEVHIEDRLEIVPTQYFRKLMTAHSAFNAWDWRRGMNPDYLLKMYFDFVNPKKSENFTSFNCNPVQKSP